ncbi:hypothetical protein ACH4F6_01745 [Streptomyces sp. NPDC017936]|uniref:hypothetical protein n=1 Tax=Streptomyces sp. NPDC017936 TaxID=3365016 RepID=UPI0037B5819C
MPDAAPWLRVPEEARRVCAGSGDAHDALVAAPAARAVRARLTTRPSAEDAGLARVEGWIHVPDAGSPARLPPG